METSHSPGRLSSTNHLKASHRPDGKGARPSTPPGKRSDGLAAGVGRRNRGVVNQARCRRSAQCSRTAVIVAHALSTGGQRVTHQRWRLSRGQRAAGGRTDCGCHMTAGGAAFRASASRHAPTSPATTRFLTDGASARAAETRDPARAMRGAFEAPRAILLTSAFIFRGVPPA